MIVKKNQCIIHIYSLINSIFNIILIKYLKLLIELTNKNYNFMGCCQAKDANHTVSADSNYNLQNGSKKDEEQNKATVATAVIII